MQVLHGLSKDGVLLSPEAPITEVRDHAWRDVAVVAVPARTKRKTIIEKGLEKAGMIEGGKTLEVRVLDAASAHVTKATVRQPAPQLELG